MHSTGVYWRPVYAVPEGDFRLVLVNARHVKQVPGRKTGTASGLLGFLSAGYATGGSDWHGREEYGERGDFFVRGDEVGGIA